MIKVSDYSNIFPNYQQQGIQLGQIQANRALQNGDIWSSLIKALGNNVAQGIQQYNENQLNQQAQQRVNSALYDTTQTRNPQTNPSISPAMQSRGNQINDVAGFNAVGNVPTFISQQRFSPTMEKIAPLLSDPRTAPMISNVLGGMKTVQDLNRPDLMSANAGDVILDRKTMQPVYNVPPKPTSATEGVWQTEKNPDGGVKQYKFGNSIQSRSVKIVNGKQVEEKYDPLGNIPVGSEPINLNFTPEEKKLMDKIANYEIDPSKATSLRNNSRQRLMEGMAVLHPEYDQTQYATKSAVRKDFTSGVASKNIRSLNTAIGHLNSLGEASDALQNGDVQVLNRLANAYKTQTGKSAPTVFNAVKTAVAGELATTFKGTGGTDQEIKQMVETINSSQSPQQVKDVVKTYIDLVESRLGAMGEQYKTALGKPVDFQILNDKSKSIIQKIKGIPQGATRTKPLDQMTDQELIDYENSLTGKK